MSVTNSTIQKAIDLLNAGEVVAIPTETVYGLAANGLDEFAVKKIFEIKNRPLNNPLILHFSNNKALMPFVNFTKDNNLKKYFELLYNEFCPGPLTFLLPKSKLVPNVITAGSDRVAVRFPFHPIAQQILNGLTFPLAAPSANPSGYISPSCAAHVKNQLGDKVKLIIDGGRCEGGIESTIIGWENNAPIIYRKGLITAEDIEKVIGVKPLYKVKTGSKLDAPGMMTSHYAPLTKTTLSENIEVDINKYQSKKIGVIKILKDNQNLSVSKVLYLSEKGDLKEIAQNLYALMHEMDDANLDVILIEKAPEIGVGIAINDRLGRAVV